MGAYCAGCADYGGVFACEAEGHFVVMIDLEEKMMGSVVMLVVRLWMWRWVAVEGSGCV